MQKFFLSFTIFLSCAAYVLAATGDGCLTANSITTAFVAGLGGVNGRADFNATGFTAASLDQDSLVEVRNYQTGACKYDYGLAADGNRPAYGYWFSFQPSVEVVASIELTNANHHSETFYTRLVMFSTAVGATCASTANLNCEGRINDMCQGYPTQPLPYTFHANRVYYVFVETPDATVATHTFALSFVKRTIIYREDFESQANGQLPTDWTRESRSTYGGWDVTSRALADTFGSANVSIIDASPVGGVGNRVLYINPFKNGPYNRTACSTPSGQVVCDHTRDDVVTRSFDLSEFPDATLIFSNFFTDGRTDIAGAGSAKLKGTIDASVNGGAFVNIAELSPVANSGANPKFNTERFSLAAVASNANVTLRFRFSMNNQNDLQFGWVIDNILISPVTDYDMCEDDFSCTSHTCDILASSTTKGCKNHANNTICDDLSVTCSINLCNPTNATAGSTTGCTFTPNNTRCSDGITCTEDICDKDDSDSDPITGCISKERNDQCNDNLMCTVDYCYGRNNTNFGLADPITGCYNKDGCDDDVDCTTDTCEKVPGLDDKCLHTIDFNKCDDKIDCTYELTCDPEQPGYDNVSGCIRIPMHEWCDDNDPCTIDTCEPSLGEQNSCVNTNVTCDDCLQCTVDYCVDGACEHTPDNTQCDDHFDCTVDICDESLGKCTNNANDTYCEYFGDPCMIHYCRPHASADGSGCVSFPKVCDDEIACTEDLCDSDTGACYFVANTSRCDDGLACTDDECDATLGKCVNKPNSVHCDDMDECTIDFCSMNGTCDSYEKDCSDEILCSEDSCFEGECQHNFNNTNCDDHIACTEDVCDEFLGKCTNNPSDLYCATHGSKCFIHFCNPESSPDATGCYSVEKDCSDAITCTLDYCDEVTGECYHVANDSFCDDGHDCTEDICDVGLGRCTNFPLNTRCEDGNVCTAKDICGCDGECTYVEKDCNDQIYCTVDSCDPSTTEGCVHEPNSTLCDDGNDCTEDICSIELGRCVNTPINDLCPGRSSCESGTCSLEAKGCVYESHDDWCEDLVGCTLDICNGASGCVHAPRNSLCDDGIGCTEDICNSTGCLYVPHNNWCVDNIGCTDDICSTTEDCLNPIIPNSCDDGINCTKDWCSLSADCQNDAMDSWCSDGVPCTEDKCVADDVNGEFCHNIARDDFCQDGFACSSNVCDFELNCVSNYTLCPWYERTLDDKICIECMSSSAQIEQTRYEDGTGAMSFRTLSADSGVLEDKMVLTPDNTVIIGGDQNDVPIGKGSGLVIGNNMRIVPQEAGFDLPVCNEIRRGTFVVTQKAVPCGEDTCHEDVVQICVKDQTYHYVTLSTEKTAL